MRVYACVYKHIESERDVCIFWIHQNIQSRLVKEEIELDTQKKQLELVLLVFIDFRRIAISRGGEKSSVLFIREINPGCNCSGVA